MNLSQNIKDPKPPRFLVYQKVTPDQAETLYTSADRAEATALLNQIFNPHDLINEFIHPDDQSAEQKAAILIDFHTQNLKFAQENAYTPRKLSTFLELMNYCLYQSIKQRLSREDAFHLFKEHCLRHAV